jgi:hypothetical protein
MHIGRMIDAFLIYSLTRVSNKKINKAYIFNHSNGTEYLKLLKSLM